MAGCARMVQFEAALSARPGAEHSRVLAHAEKLLHKAEEYLEQRDAEAGAAASGAPSSEIAAPDQDARFLEGIDAFMGSDSVPRLGTETTPWRGPPPRRRRRVQPRRLPPRRRSPFRRSSWSMSRREAYEPQARCRGGSRRSLTWRLRVRPWPQFGEAQVVPDAEPDGSFLCPECGKGMSGRLRGFDLHQYLGEGTEGTGPVPWAGGSDAVPDTADRTPVAVRVAVTTEVPVRVMVVFDYLRWSEQDAALVEIQSAFQRSLPGALVPRYEVRHMLATHFL